MPVSPAGVSVVTWAYCMEMECVFDLFASFTKIKAHPFISEYIAINY